ncbi:MAG: hypothetical protein P8R54_04585 [Myxococcota bacterium]|nr:hypothetical protein [Myxococcota bacterium]
MSDDILQRIARLLSIDPIDLDGITGPSEALAALLTAIETSSEAAPLSAKEISRLQRLLISDAREHQQQGLSLLESCGDEAAWEAVVQGCSVDEQGCFQSTQTRITHGLFQAFCINPSVDHRNVTTLDLRRSSWLDPSALSCLSRLSSLHTVHLDDVAAGADLTALSSLDGLVALYLQGKGVDAAPIARMTGLETLSLRGCRAPVDLSRFTRLQSLTVSPLLIGGALVLSVLPDSLRTLVVAFAGTEYGSGFLPGRVQVSAQSRFDFSALGALAELEGLTIELELPKLGPPGALDAVGALTSLTRLRVGTRPPAAEHPNTWLLKGAKLAAWLVDLRRYIAIRDDDAAALAIHRDVTVLDLSGSWLTSADGLSHLICLERLSLKGCERLRDLDGLAGLAALSWLNIDFKVPATPDAAAYVNPCSSGGYLGRQGVGDAYRYGKLFDTRSGVAAYQDKLRLCAALRSGSPSALAPFAHSESVSLREWRFRDVDSLRDFQHLRWLDLSDSKVLSSLAGITGLTKLRSLLLVNCPQLQSLPRLSGSLEELKLYGAGIKRIEPGSDLSKLTSLNLENCHRLESLEGLQTATGLTRLSISGTSMLTSLDGIESLSSLQTLQLHRCSSLRSLNGIENLSSLTSLSVRSCEALVNIDALASLPQLETLYLYGCARLRRVDALARLFNLKTLCLAHGQRGAGNNTIPANVPPQPFPSRPASAVHGSLWVSEMRPGYWPSHMHAHCGGVWSALRYIGRYQSAVSTFVATLPAAEGVVAVPRSIADIPRHIGARQLHLSGLPLTDLSVLRDFHSLQVLFIDDCKALEDVSAIRSLPELVRVEAHATSFSPEIKGALRSRAAVVRYQLDLQSLAIGRVLVASPPDARAQLRALLSELAAQLGTPITTLALRRLPRAVTSLSLLADLPELAALKELDLSRCEGLTSIDGILGYPALRKVKLGHCHQMDTKTLSSARAVKKYSAQRGVSTEG